MAVDAWAGIQSGNPEDGKVINNKLYYDVDDSIHGRELWVSDGTPANTYLLKDMTPGTGGNQTFDFALCNGLIYFRGKDAAGWEPWVTDGTTGGTRMLKNINPGSQHPDSDPYYFTPYHGKTYFTADTDAHNVEMYVTDGTDTGTHRVKDIYPGSGGSYPTYYTVWNDMLYFGASDGTAGNQLWKSDGTEAGTVFVATLNQPQSGFVNANNFAGYHGKLYFIADDAINGYELWSTDGTTLNTHIVQPTGAFTNPLFNSTLLHAINRLIFAAHYDGNGIEPFQLYDSTAIDTPQSVQQLQTTGFTAVLYPNPATTEVNLFIADSKSEAVAISLFDVSGRQLNQLSEAVNAGNNTINLSLPQSVTPGNYFMKLQTATDVSVLRLVVR
jgi:ELWxxDGT repeat protein